MVVDRTVITQLQADQTGIDFMELSANLIRAHHLRYSSTPSILDSDTTSKGLSPISLGYSPPSYEDIFGEKNNDLPPSYSELSLLFRQRQMESNEMHSFNFGSMAARIKETIRETVLDIPPEETYEPHKEIENTDEIAIAVPFDLQETDFPSNADSVGIAAEDICYSNCKYGVISMGSDRRARIKCYCYEDSIDATNNCVLTTRSDDANACSSSMRRDIENDSECSVYTAEGTAMDHKTFSETDTQYGNRLLNLKDNNSKCTLDHSRSNEETCKQSCDDIRESSL